MCWGLRSGKGRLRLVRDNSLTSWVYIVILQSGHFAYRLGITGFHVCNGSSLTGKDWRFLNTVFSRVDVVGAVVDSKLGGIRDHQFPVSLRGRWHRLRTCIIPVKILGSTNSKPGIPWLTGSPCGDLGSLWVTATMKWQCSESWNSDIGLIVERHCYGCKNSCRFFQTTQWSTPRWQLMKTFES